MNIYKSNNDAQHGGAGLPHNSGAMTKNSNKNPLMQKCCTIMCVNMLVEEFLQILYSTCLILWYQTDPTKLYQYKCHFSTKGLRRIPNMELTWASCNETDQPLLSLYHLTVWHPQFLPFPKICIPAPQHPYLVHCSAETSPHTSAQFSQPWM